ncbi:hypothetical protein HanRHA438_Chr09g0428321 [Helianthus annuus]|nr:hypothetical protein HanRHA438_Chr09g0428321 [Helianthus annuus]
MRKKFNLCELNMVLSEPDGKKEEDDLGDRGRALCELISCEEDNFVVWFRERIKRKAVCGSKFCVNMKSREEGFYVNKKKRRISVIQDKSEEEAREKHAVIRPVCTRSKSKVSRRDDLCHRGKKICLV